MASNRNCLKMGGQVIYFGGWNNGIVGLIRTIHTCERFMTPKVFVAERFKPPPKKNSIAGLIMTLTSNVTFRTYRFHCVRTIDPSETLAVIELHTLCDSYKQGIFIYVYRFLVFLCVCIPLCFLFGWIFTIPSFIFVCYH